MSNKTEDIIMRKSKRIALTLDPEIDKTITQLAKLTNQTKVGIVNGVLKDMHPMLEQTLFAIKKAQKGKNTLALMLMNDVLEDAEQQFKDAQIELKGLHEPERRPSEK
jgi:hypothetical protein